MRTILVLAAALALAGCDRQAANNAAAVPAENLAVDVEEVPLDEGAAPANALAATDGWVGKWAGPEGLVLDVAKAAAPGSYDLKVTLLDGTDNYTGTADGDAIRFTRDGVEERIRAGTGDETGLKYLAGKQNCLIIKPGEGFCRG